MRIITLGITVTRPVQDLLVFWATFAKMKESFCPVIKVVYYKTKEQKHRTYVACMEIPVYGHGPNDFAWGEISLPCSFLQEAVKIQ
jgi:hypothetical protein